MTIRAEFSKNKQEHSLPLTDFLVLLLTQRKSDSPYVFPGRGGRSHLVDPGHIIEQHVIKNSGCSFVIHDLRRSFITMAAKLGVQHHVIKKLVNHISSTGATDGYIVIEIDELREPMALINNRFLTLFGCDISDWRQSDEIAS